MKTVSVWAASGDVPMNVCEDARLRKESDGFKSDVKEFLGFSSPFANGDTPRGQAGWEVGINYTSNFHQLATTLALDVAPKQGKIRRLAIHAHGLPGQVFVNGSNRPPLELNTLEGYKADLALIRDSLAPDAVVLFVGCLAGQGKAGDAFLMEVSRLLPGRKVVAFETIGFAPAGKLQERAGENCTEPGMRDTDAPDGSHDPLVARQRAAAWAPLWNRLDLLPWASETSPHAVVARNGVIIQQRFDRESAAEKREEAAAAIPRPPLKKPAKGQEPLPMMVELTAEEQLVYAVLDMAQPKTVDMISWATGLHQLQVQQALKGLTRKMLITWVQRGEMGGYVRFLNRYVG
jgi:hypothetical protein